MRKLLDEHEGVVLGLEEYREEFQRYFWKIEDYGFWKLERRQTFQEPGDESWEAFADGDWERSMRLLEDRRLELMGYYHSIACAGFRTSRVRVVEEPLSPYLRWELRLLRIRNEYGAQVKIAFPETVEHYETDGPLPELVVLGDLVMYEVVYDDAGIMRGGVRYTDTNLINYCRARIKWFHASGVPISIYMSNWGM